MAKIIAPNKDYAGISAGIAFAGGEGFTDDPHLIKWFVTHGYQIGEEEKKEAESKPLKKKRQKEE